MIIYYAHFSGIYNTKQEERDIETIKKLFPEATIINPNKPEHQEGYKVSGLGMDYFFNLVRESDALVFRGCVNGKIGAGVWGEIQIAQEKGIPVIELPSFLDRQMSVDETRLMLKELGVR